MGKDNKVAGDSAIGQKSSEQGNSGQDGAAGEEESKTS